MWDEMEELVVLQRFKEIVIARETSYRLDENILEKLLLIFWLFIRITYQEQKNTQEILRWNLDEITSGQKKTLRASAFLYQIFLLSKIVLFLSSSTFVMADRSIWITFQD